MSFTSLRSLLLFLWLLTVPYDVPLYLTVVTPKRLSSRSRLWSRLGSAPWTLHSVENVRKLLLRRQHDTRPNWIIERLYVKNSWTFSDANTDFIYKKEKKCYRQLIFLLHDLISISPIWTFLIWSRFLCNSIIHEILNQSGLISSQNR